MDLKGFPEEKGPVKKDDVDFMGIKKEKILDFSPIGCGPSDLGHDLIKTETPECPCEEKSCKPQQNPCFR